MPHDSSVHITPHPPLIRLTTDTLNLEEVLTYLAAPQAGGEALFVGRVRDHNHGLQVEYLEYEAYAPMAERLLGVLAAHLQRTYHPVRLALVHRLGRLAIGDAAVVVGVSAVHRDAAFRASREGIDRLKLEIPIWKKEFFAGGARWVDNCHGCAAVAAEYADYLSHAPAHQPQGSIEHAGSFVTDSPG